MRKKIERMFNHPDLLFYNMKLQCLVAEDLKIENHILLGLRHLLM